MTVTELLRRCRGAEEEIAELEIRITQIGACARTEAVMRRLDTLRRGMEARRADWADEKTAAALMLDNYVCNALAREVLIQYYILGRSDRGTADAAHISESYARRLRRKWTGILQERDASLPAGYPRAKRKSIKP